MEAEDVAVKIIDCQFGAAKNGPTKWPSVGVQPAWPGLRWANIFLMFDS